MDSVKYKALPFKYKLARFTLKLHTAYPFLGELCMRVEKYKKEDMKNLAATDGFHLFLNEEGLNALPEESLNFVLLHELFHIILKHKYPKEMPFYAKQYWNIGFDLNANWLLMSMEYELIRNGLPIQPSSESYLSSDDLSDDPSHRVANAFLEQAKQQGILSDNPPLLVQIEWKSFKAIVPNTADFAFDVLGEDDTDSLHTDADVQELLASCAKSAGNDGLPQHLKKLMDELIKGRKLPWHLIFKRYLEIMKGCDDSDFCPPDKRMLYSGMILPDNNDDDKALNNVLVVIDVSSSVDKDELLAQVWRVASILNDLEFNGYIIAFASKVHQEALLTDKASLKKFIDELQVGGGTDWSDVVSYVKRQKRKSKPIIVFTDGYFCSFDKGLQDLIFIVQNDYPLELSNLGKVIQVQP